MSFWKSVLVSGLMLYSADAGAHGTVRVYLTDAEKARYGPTAVVKTFFDPDERKAEENMTILLDDLFQEVAADYGTKLPVVIDKPTDDVLVIGPKHERDVGSYRGAPSEERERIYDKLLTQIRPLLQTMHAYGFVMRDPHGGNIMEDANGDLHIIDPGFFAVSGDKLPGEWREYIEDAFPGMSEDLPVVGASTFEKYTEDAEEYWSALLMQIAPVTEGWRHQYLYSDDFHDGGPP